MVSFTKRAQVPFSSWLPAAMAAPTPVSSLVHSSTLVTAGIYLLLRLNIFFSWELKYGVFFVGIITIVLALISSILVLDLKKIIAFSTIIHLGFIVMILRFSLVDIVFFHLIIHAYFKALLFLAGGVSIHMRANYQRVSKISSVYYFSPLNFYFFFVSIFSMAGLPFISGFFSKDLFLERVVIGSNYLFIIIFSFILSLSTIFYCLRLLKIIYFSRKKTGSVFWVDFYLKEFYKSIIGLTLLSIISGKFLIRKIFIYSNFVFLSIYMKLIIPLMIMLIIVGA